MAESQGSLVELTAADDHGFQAYHVPATGQRRGCLVVIQEIFGVNGHIRGVAERYAAEGYEVYAPALFDRIERGVELGYGEDDIAAGLALMRQADLTDAVLDVQTCIGTLRPHGAVGLVGYCWGGTVSWVSACRAIGVAAAVCYYGGQIAQNVDLEPACPVMMHFGDQDAAIPLSDVDAVQAAQPGVDVHVYQAGHGFNCDQRGSYDEVAAALALERSLAFYAEHMG
jgi:carboxymethylenebutenolidase